MGDPLRKVSRGEMPTAPDAQRENVMVDAMKDYLQRKPNTLSPNAPQVPLDQRLYVKHVDDDNDVPWYGVVGFGAIVSDPNVSETLFQNQKTLESAPPVTHAPFAIALEPMNAHANGIYAVGEVKQWGDVQCQILMLGAADGFATAITGDYTKLQSGVLSDEAEILWNEAATGVVPVWDDTTAFMVGNRVIAVGTELCYTCVKNNTNEEPPNAKYWSVGAVCWAIIKFIGASSQSLTFCDLLQNVPTTQITIQDIGGNVWCFTAANCQLVSGSCLGATPVCGCTIPTGPFCVNVEIVPVGYATMNASGESGATQVDGCVGSVPAVSIAAPSSWPEGGGYAGVFIGFGCSGTTLTASIGLWSDQGIGYNGAMPGTGDSGFSITTNPLAITTTATDPDSGAVATITITEGACTGSKSPCNPVVTTAPAGLTLTGPTASVPVLLNKISAYEMQGSMAHPDAPGISTLTLRWDSGQGVYYLDYQNSNSPLGTISTPVAVTNCSPVTITASPPLPVPPGSGIPLVPITITPVAGVPIVITPIGGSGIISSGDSCNTYDDYYTVDLSSMATDTGTVLGKYIATYYAAGTDPYGTGHAGWFTTPITDPAVETSLYPTFPTWFALCNCGGGDWTFYPVNEFGLTGVSGFTASGSPAPTGTGTPSNPTLPGLLVAHSGSTGTVTVS